MTESPSALAQGRGQLLAADIQSADRDRPPFHRFDDLTQRAILFFLVGQIFAIHEEELGAQETDAFGAGRDRLIDFAGQLQIDFERDLLAVAGAGRYVAQSVERAGFALQSPLPIFIFGQGRFAGRNDDPAIGAVDDQDVAGLYGLHQAADAEHRRQPKGARHDRRVTLGAAHHCGEAADFLRIHQRRVGWRDRLGDNDGIPRQGGEVGQLLIRERPDDPVSDFSHVLGAGTEVRIVDLIEGGGDRVDLRHDGGLGVLLCLFDAFLDAGEEARRAEHLMMRFQQDAELFGGRSVESLGLLLQLGELTLGLGDGLREAFLLIRHVAGCNLILQHAELAAFAQMGGADRHAGRDREALQDHLGRGLLGGRGLGPFALGLIRLHRTCSRSGRPGRPWPAPPVARKPAARAACRARRPAS